MNECPTCRSAIIGRPPACQQCGTPLARARWSRSSSARVLTVLCPGLGHLWLGYLYLGVFAFFGSILISCFLLSQLLMDALWRRVLAWLLAWIPWVSLWLIHLWDRRRRRVSASSVAGLIVVLLMLANGAMMGLLLIGLVKGQWV